MMKRWANHWVTMLLIVLGGWFILIAPVTARAAEPLTSAFTAIGYTSSGNYLSGTGDFSGGTADSISYPRVYDVSANYANNGYPTNRTTQIKARFSDDWIQFGQNAFIPHFQLNVFGGSLGDQTTLATSVLSGAAMPDLGGFFKTFISLDDQPVTFNVNLTDLSHELPLRIGFNITARQFGGYSGTASYQLAKLSTPATLLHPTITGTAHDSTASAVKVLSTAKTITGTGSIPGDHVEVDVDDGHDGYTSLGTTAVQPDGSFEVAASQPLSADQKLRATETNDYDGGSGFSGASATAYASVEAPRVTLTATTPTVLIRPADLDSITDNAGLIRWLTEHAGIQAVASEGGSISYSAAESHPLTTVQDLPAGQATTVTLKATADGVTSSGLAVTVVKQAGTLSFGDVTSAINFGRHPLPATTTDYAPASPISVPISDNRASGAAWTLSATATPLSGSGGQFVGDVSYQVPGGSSQPLTGSSRVVAQGNRQAGQTSINATTGWTTASDNHWAAAAHGIFLRVFPGTTAGDYHGTLEWTLSDVPNQ